MPNGVPEKKVVVAPRAGIVVDVKSIWDAISRIKIADFLKGLEVNLEKVEADAHAYVARRIADINNSPQLTPEQKADLISKLTVSEGYLDKVVKAALPSNLIGLAPAIVPEIKQLWVTKKSVVVHTPVELA